MQNFGVILSVIAIQNTVFGTQNQLFKCHDIDDYVAKDSKCSCLVEHSKIDEDVDLVANVHCFDMLIRPFYRILETLSSNSTENGGVFAPTFCDLHIQHSFLPKIMKQLFHYISFRRVKLTDSKIYQLVPGLFDTMAHSLEELVINRTQIQIIQRRVFNEKLTKLKTLTITHNNLLKINNQIFRGLENLQLLNLSSNRINHIDCGAFSELKNLKKLDLSNNELHEVQSCVFDNLDNLQFLNIDGNQLKNGNEIVDKVLIGQHSGVLIGNGSKYMIFMYISNSN